MRTAQVQILHLLFRNYASFFHKHIMLKLFLASLRRDPTTFDPDEHRTLAVDHASATFKAWDT